MQWAVAVIDKNEEQVALIPAQDDGQSHFTSGRRNNVRATMADTQKHIVIVGESN